MGERTIQFGGFTLDVKRSRLVDQDGAEIRLRPKSFDMLRILLSRAGEIVRKEELLAAVWGHTHLSDDGLVQCVRDIRVALNDETKQLLRTVPKRGYLLDVKPLEVCPDDEAPAGAPSSGDDVVERPAAPGGRAWAGRAALSMAAVLAGLVILLGAYGPTLHLSASPMVGPGTSIDVRAGDRARAALAEFSGKGINPIMVLPFRVADTSTRTAAVADSLIDELIGNFSLIPSLRVISRSTSELYRGKLVDVAALGQEIGVRYVVEGSVHVHEDIVLVDVALIDASMRLQLWTAHFESSLSDLPSARRDIIRGVARQLQLSVFLAEEANHAPHPTADPTLNDLLARGWAAIVRAPGEGVTASAADFFRKALERAPGNESAQLGFAGSQIIPATQLLGKKEMFDLAGAAARLETVLAGNPRQSLALLYRGMLRRLNDDMPGAREDVLRAIDINPSFAVAYGQAGHIFYRLGEYDRGLEYIRYAMRLSPKDPGLGVWSYTAGMIELERGNDDAAFEWFESAAALIPRNIYARLGLIAVRIARGDAEGSQGELEKLRRQAPWITRASLNERLGIEATPVNTRPRLVAALQQAFERRN